MTDECITVEDALRELQSRTMYLKEKGFESQ